MHRTTIVYPDAEKRTLILPVISRDAVGVRVSLYWQRQNSHASY